MNTNQNQNDSSNVNTILIVLVLLAVVGGLVWFFTDSGANVSDNTTGAGVNINLPAGNDAEGGDNQ